MAVDLLGNVAAVPLVRASAVEEAVRTPGVVPVNETSAEPIQVNEAPDQRHPPGRGLRRHLTPGHHRGGPGPGP